MEKHVLGYWATFCQIIPIVIYALSAKAFRKQKDVIIIVILSIVGLIADNVNYHDISVSIEIYACIEFICFLLFFYYTKPSLYSKTILNILLIIISAIRIAFLPIDKKLSINFPFLVFQDLFLLTILIIYFYKVLKTKKMHIAETLAFWTVLAYVIHEIFYTLLAFRITPISNFDFDWIIIRIVGALRCIFVSIGFLIIDNKINKGKYPMLESIAQPNLKVSNHLQKEI
jgi:hypothetical protein